MVKATVNNTFYFCKSHTALSTKYRVTTVIQRAIKLLQEVDEIEFDTETTGLDFLNNDIVLYQFGAKGFRFVINQADFPITLFKEVLETKKIIIHNAKFDLKYLFKHGIVPTDIYDTFLAEKVLTTGHMHPQCGLASIALRRLGVNLDKSIRDSFNKNVVIGEEEIVYSADDVTYLAEIKRLQLEDIEKEQVLQTVELENKFVLVLAYIEFNGIGFDAVKWRKKCEEDMAERDRLHNLLNSMVMEMGDHEFVLNGLFGQECLINWASPAQVAPLFKKLGIDVSVADKKAGGEKDSVLSTVLEPQVDKHPIVRVYLDYKKADKLVSSFGENFFEYIDSSTNRIYTEYKQILDTGRLSCGGKGKDRSYPNMQQIPSDKRHRECFVSKEGYNLIVADYSSQESRILVDVSGEPALTDFYLQGEADLHSYTAKLVYSDLKDLTLDEIKKQHKDKRSIMKTVNFGLAYGGAATTIARNANIPIELAEQVYADYFKAFPDLEKYFEGAREYPLLHGYVLVNSVSGRKSYIDFYDKFIELDNEVNNRAFWTKYRQNKTPEDVEKVREFFKYKGVIERRGLNYVIQGTAADMSKLAAWYLFKYIRDKGLLFKVFIPNIVHDELHVECPEDMAEEFAKVLQDSMQRAGAVFCKKIPITAEVEISTWWSK